MAKDNLAQAAQDVIPESSAGGEAAPAATEQASDDSGGKGKGRTIDEVRGELVRRIEDANAATREQLARIEGMMSARQAEPARPAGPPDINTLPLDELEALRPSIPKEQLGAFERLVADRRVAEAVRGHVTSEFSKRETERTRREANQEAFNRYPDLHNETSPMRKMTNKVLDERGGVEGAGVRAVLDAANEAASRLGITAATRQSGGPDIRQPGSRTAPAPTGGAGTPTLSKEKADSIAKALRGALPAGKKFDIERIQKSHADYTAHRNLIVKQ